MGRIQRFFSLEPSTGSGIDSSSSVDCISGGGSNEDGSNGSSNSGGFNGGNSSFGINTVLHPERDSPSGTGVSTGTVYDTNGSSSSSISSSSSSSNRNRSSIDHSNAGDRDASFPSGSPIRDGGDYGSSQAGVVTVTTG